MSNRSDASLLPQRIFFVGAGGIGMANLVRYFLSKGIPVAGYDRTRSRLTDKLTEEGATIFYDDDPQLIPEPFRDPSSTEVVFTPAVPADSAIMTYFRNGGFNMMKRAKMLGLITANTKGICVAGSHGKTTTSSMIANILNGTDQGVTAFLGGILRNIDSNLLISHRSEYSVVEADEYDRSFHQLSPWLAIVTSTDPDHLDIYGDEEHYLEAFSIFTSLVRPGGHLLIHTGLKMKPAPQPGVDLYSYSGGPEGDFHAEDIRYGDGTLTFTLVGPDLRIADIELGVPVEINIDNAVAAAAASWLAGASADEIRRGLKTFMGAKRRFEIHHKGREVLIDDYAHSPHEIEASIASVRKLFPGRKITVVFQPHLYTRTRDFAPEFMEALSGADDVWLLEIYPAREKPIPGVTSEMLLEGIKSPKKRLLMRKDLLNSIKNTNFDILMTLGAADIDVLLPEIKEILSSRQ